MFLGSEQVCLLYESLPLNNWVGLRGRSLQAALIRTDNLSCSFRDVFASILQSMLSLQVFVLTIVDNVREKLQRFLFTTCMSTLRTQAAR